MIKIGIFGLGFMGKTHFKNLIKSGRVKIAAIFDLYVDN